MPYIMTIIQISGDMQCQPMAEVTIDQVHNLPGENLKAGTRQWWLFVSLTEVRLTKLQRIPQ